MMPNELRAAVYVQCPREYEIAGCPCGNDDPDWSEFKGMLWCPICQVDFVPAHSGIFDGPIALSCARLMGIDLRQIEIATGRVIEVDDQSGGTR